MVFCAADQGAPSGSAANAAAPAVDPTKAAADAAAANATVDYKAKLLSLLGLDDTADAAAIDAKIAEYSTTMGGVPDLTAKASTADQLQAKLDELDAKYQALNTEQQALWKAKQEADADEILKVYEGHFVDDASKAAIRNILLSDKDAGIAILNGLKKPEAAVPVVDAAAAAAATADAGKTATPPSPQHDPNAAAAAATETEKAAKISARAKELVASSNPKISLTKAYQLAEAELNKPAA